MSDIATALAGEKDRLTKKRIDLEAQVTDLQTTIASVDHELQAIDAYHTALSGKTAKGPRGSKRDAVLAIIKDSPVSRAGIIEKLKAQGHEKPDAGLSNLLNVLKKKGTITAQEGRYALS